MGRTGLRLKAHIAALAIGLLTGYMLVPDYGATGIAIALCLSVIVIESTLVRATVKELK